MAPQGLRCAFLRFACWTGWRAVRAGQQDLWGAALGAAAAGTPDAHAHAPRPPPPGPNPSCAQPKCPPPSPPPPPPQYTLSSTVTPLNTTHHPPAPPAPPHTPHTHLTRYPPIVSPPSQWRWTAPRTTCATRGCAPRCTTRSSTSRSESWRVGLFFHFFHSYF